MALYRLPYLMTNTVFLLNIQNKKNKMNTVLSKEQIEQYNAEGFLVIDDFLNPTELEDWRQAVSEAINERNGQKMPGKEIKTGQEDGINKESEYFGKVFDQMINLWQTNEKMRKIILDERLGKMVSQLAGWEGTRIWHDQALIKRPWANPTSWHLDTPFWSFSDPRALSIWVALDDATLENGCLYFIPGTHRLTGLDTADIGKNMDAIFTQYPQLRQRPSRSAPIKAGSCSFHNGLTIHGAGANMTNGLRRAMTCAYMPEGATFNGTQNILTDAQVALLQPGDLLNDNVQNPLIYTCHP